MQTITDLAQLLRTSADLLEIGWTPAGLRHAVGGGRLVRVRRGWYVQAERWNGLNVEERHAVQVVATVRDMRDGGGVVSHASAAAMWGLPLYRVSPARVQLLLPPSARASNSSDVERRVGHIGDDDVVEIGGVRCTSIARTVFDVSRSLRPEAALSIADAALRRRAWDQASHLYSANAAAAWREELEVRLRRMPGGRGVRQARWVAGFADGRAQLPGESVSRLQLVRLGFARPDLQVRVRAPHGYYWIDFGLEDVGAWGEFDGVAKYTDPALLAGRTTAQALLLEKQREDWIRGTTRRPVVRWQARHIATSATLGQLLASFGVRPPR